MEGIQSLNEQNSIIDTSILQFDSLQNFEVLRRSYRTGKDPKGNIAYPVIRDVFAQQELKMQPEIPDHFIGFYFHGQNVNDLETYSMTLLVPPDYSYVLLKDMEADGNKLQTEKYLGISDQLRENLKNLGSDNSDSSVDGDGRILQKGVIRGTNHTEYPVVLSDGHGQIRLRINQAQTAVTLSKAGESDQSHFQMEILKDTPFVIVTNRYLTVHGQNLNFGMYQYDDRKLVAVFNSLRDLTCQIGRISWEKGEVAIGLPFAHTSMTYRLSSQEKKETDAIAADIKSNRITLDEEYMKSIAHNIVCSPTDLQVADVDKDGRDEVLLLTNIRTVGARTPVHVNTEVVFVFSTSNQKFQLASVATSNDPETFNRDRSNFH